MPENYGPAASGFIPQQTLPQAIQGIYDLVTGRTNQMSKTQLQQARGNAYGTDLANYYKPTEVANDTTRANAGMLGSQAGMLNANVNQAESPYRVQNMDLTNPVNLMTKIMSTPAAMMHPETFAPVLQQFQDQIDPQGKSSRDLTHQAQLAAGDAAFEQAYLNTKDPKVQSALLQSPGGYDYVVRHNGNLPVAPSTIANKSTPISGDAVLHPFTPDASGNTYGLVPAIADVVREGYGSEFGQLGDALGSIWHGLFGKSAVQPTTATPEVRRAEPVQTNPMALQSDQKYTPAAYKKQMYNPKQSSNNVLDADMYPPLPIK